MKSQIQKKKKKNAEMVELLIPTLNKIIKNRYIYFFVIMNNRLKIISVHGVWEDFFQKKLLVRGQKLFWANKIIRGGGGVLNWTTNDQIMPRFGRSFINDKCIFQ